MNNDIQIRMLERKREKLKILYAATIDNNKIAAFIFNKRISKIDKLIEELTNDKK